MPGCHASPPLWFRSLSSALLRQNLVAKHLCRPVVKACDLGSRDKSDQWGNGYAVKLYVLNCIYQSGGTYIFLNRSSASGQRIGLQLFSCACILFAYKDLQSILQFSSQARTKRSKRSPWMRAIQNTVAEVSSVTTGRFWHRAGKDKCIVQESKENEGIKGKAAQRD